MNIYKNKDVSLKAIGIYLMIKDLNSKNEKVTQSIIASMTNTGDKAIATGVKELKDKGYLEIEKVNVDGKFVYNYKLKK